MADIITTFDYFFYFLFALLEQVTCNHFPLCTIVYVSKAIFFFLDSRAPQWKKKKKLVPGNSTEWTAFRNLTYI